ncbi:glycosyltransferase family 39 protein [Lacinutrix cladophorae]
MIFLKKYQDQFGLLLLWLIIILVINPIGDFPLNDDWCYAKSVKTLYEDGYLKLYNWGEMTLVSHVYWGYFFTKIFGFSFTILRFSTLVMGFATILGVYQLCKLANVSRWISLFTAVLCMVNPIFLSLSFSFMTDVPFYCLTIWILYFSSKALKTNKWQPIIWALFLCIWAFLIRQLAIVFPIVWLLTVILSKKITLKNSIKAVAPLFILLLFSLWFSYYMEANGLLQERYNSKFNVLITSLKNINFQLIKLTTTYLLTSMAYLGFLMAPLYFIYIQNNTFKGVKIAITIWTVLVMVFIVKMNKVLPSLDNIWIDFGVGPTTLIVDNTSDFTQAPSNKAPRLFWLLITAIGVFCSVALLLKSRIMLLAIFYKKTVSPIVILAFVFVVVYLSPFLIVGVYDRYLLPLFPVTILFLFGDKKLGLSKTSKYFTMLFLGVLTWFSVFATHDYLSWNRVRWQVLEGLQEKGVSINHIQGGVEFTTWHHFSETQDAWWENIIPIYTLVFNPKKDDVIVGEHSYTKWFPGKGKIYVIYDASLDSSLN